MRVDRTGRLVSEKETLRALILSSADRLGSAITVDILSKDGDAEGCNWTAVVEGAIAASPVEETRELSRTIAALRAAYNLPSEQTPPPADIEDDF